MSLEVTDFQEQVLRQSENMPVLVDFWAPWCAPCNTLSPVLEMVASRFANQLIFVKVNIDDHKALAEEHGIRNIPQVKLYSHGEVIDEFAGLRAEYQIDQWIREALPGRFAAQIREARGYLERGEHAKGRELLNQVLEKDESDEEARVLLAKSFVFDDPSQAERFAGGIPRESDQFELSMAVRILARAILLPPSPDQGGSAAAAQAFAEANAKLREQDLEGALAGFVRVAEIDREWDKSAGKRMCVALFKYLGERHSLTQQYRDALSRVLHA